MSSRRTAARLRVLSAARIYCTLLLVTVCVASAACALGGRNRAVSQPAKARSTEPVLTAEQKAVKSVTDLICQGKFAQAKTALAGARTSAPKAAAALDKLQAVIDEHDKIVDRRAEGKAEAYEEQITELKKAQGIVDVNDPNEIADLNDPNDVVEVLAIVSRVSEYATAEQRDRLMADDFVKKAFEKAVDNASQFETEGKWLEAYTNCYYWLEAIDPNNKAYADYAEELVEKSGIVAAFQDSPCETSKERFDGIKRVMFIRAIAALNLYYVNIIDYGEMAVKGIDRCKLLCDVVDKSPQFMEFMSNSADANDPNDPAGEGKNTFVKPSSQNMGAFCAAITGLAEEVTGSPAGFGRDEFLEVFEKLLALNDATAKLPETIVIAQFSEAALQTLDPYTVMVWPKQVEDFEKMMMNEFTGIGIEISKRQGLLTVASLLPGTPAYRSGLDAGDVISGVDGLETKDMTLNCAVKKITGPKGTKVTLTIDRPGETTKREITIVRDKITVPTIRGWQRSEDGQWHYMLDETDKIGYVRMMSFSAETADDFAGVLDDLENSGMKALILDLRWNSGGLLDTAVAVSDMFIDEGLIVKTQPGFGRVPDYKTATKGATHPDYPMVVLINSSSASASEIVAGALGDERYERATLVGNRTHGKGSVQGITHFPGGRAQLKYTMAYYHLPSGQRVESRDAREKKGLKDWGVGPDVPVKLRSDELRDMIDIQRDNDVLVQANHDNSNGDLKKHSQAETLESDPQMAIALLVARAKLVETQEMKSN